MKNWLRKKLKSFLYEDEIETVSNPEPRLQTEYEETIRFFVTSARGGSIVNVSYTKSHKHHSIVYVIPDTEDLTQRISEIVSMSMLSA